MLEIQVDGSVTFQIASLHALATLIASANDLLLDDDLGKMTRRVVDQLRWLLNVDADLPAESEGLAQVNRFIDALESYLPPQQT